MLQHEVTKYLDQILSIAVKETGNAIPAHVLLHDAGYGGDPTTGNFLLKILHADGLIEPIRHPSADMGLMIVTISPKGFIFFSEGGYAAKNNNNFKELTEKQQKQELEILNLRWGFWISFISLAVSVAALLVSLFKP